MLSPGPFLFLLAVASRRNANLAGGLAGRQQGRTNKTVTWWTELGQRLANAKMLVFTMTFQQSLELTKPSALAVQASNTTPWHLQECVRSMRAKLQTQLEQLQWLSHILQVLRLLQPYVPPNDVAAFFRAFFQEGATVGLYFAVLWTHGRFCSLNVVLDAESTEHDSPEVLLHNACQCAFRKRPSSNLGAKGLWMEMPLPAQSSRRGGRLFCAEGKLT